jgi:hypothetical protein
MLSFIKFAGLWKNWQEAKALFAHPPAPRLPPADMMQHIDFASTTAAPTVASGQFYA